MSKNWVGIIGLLLCVSFVLVPVQSSAEGMKALPVAQHGALEQLAGVAMIPVDIFLAMFYAEGETYVEGRTYEGDYARHGYNRTHARWWDPFFYHHGK